jgi:competence protein ComEA
VEVDRLESESLDYRIDVNTATWVEWAQLDGIGEALAERIVADREANGPFKSVDDLRRVKGIGPKTLARIRPYLTLGKSNAAAKTH